MDKAKVKEIIRWTDIIITIAKMDPSDKAGLAALVSGYKVALDYSLRKIELDKIEKLCLNYT